MTSFVVHLDIDTPFQVEAGLALIEGHLNLLLLQGSVWPGLDRLPEWVVALADPQFVRVEGSTTRQVVDLLLPGAVSALASQVLLRAPVEAAVAALPLALSRTDPLTPRQIARLLGIKPDRARAVQRKAATLPSLSLKELH